MQCHWLTILALTKSFTSLALAPERYFPIQPTRLPALTGTYFLNYAFPISLG